MTKLGTTGKLVLLKEKADGKEEMERRREAEMVLAGFRNEASVAELCRQYGVSDVMYYKWRKAFLEGGLNELKGSSKTNSHESALKKENENLKSLIGELTVENRFLKYKGHKGLHSDRGSEKRRTSLN